MATATDTTTRSQTDEPDVSGAAGAGKDRRFAYVDGLRGLAALSVCFYHFYSTLCGAGQKKLVPAPLHHALLHGDLGVQIFFVISGFVIAFTVRNAEVSASFIGRFAIRRSLRLDPPYWVAIFLSYVLLQLTGSERGNQIDAYAYLANMFYLDNLLYLPSLVSVGWTLCLEVQFYLLFVLLKGVAQLLQRRLHVALAGAIAYVPPLALSVVFGCSTLTFPIRGTFVPYWYLFFLGALACWSIANSRALAGFGALACCLLMLQLSRVNAESIAGLATAGSLVLFGRRKLLGSVLSNRVIQYFGRISYSLYLLHPMIGNRTMRIAITRFPEIVWGWKAAALFVFALLISVVAAHLLHLFVEQPSIRWSKAWALRGSRKPAGFAVSTATKN